MLPTEIIHLIIRHLDLSSLISMSQVCSLWRSDIGEAQFKRAVLKKNPLFYLDTLKPWRYKAFAEIKRKTKCRKLKSRDYVVLPSKRDVLLPSDFYCFGLSECREFPDNSQRNSSEERREWFTSVFLSEEAFVSAIHNDCPTRRYTTLLCRQGMEVLIPGSFFMYHATSELLAVLRESTPPSVLVISYKGDSMDAPYRHIIDGGMEEQFHIFAVGKLVFLRVRDETKEEYLCFYKNHSWLFYTRPQPPYKADNYIVYDGDLWEVFRHRRKRVAHIQPVRFDGRRLTVPYFDTEETPYNIVQEKVCGYRYVLVFGHTTAQFLLDMETLQVYLWERYDDDRTLVGVTEGKIMAFVYPVEVFDRHIPQRYLEGQHQGINPLEFRGYEWSDGEYTEDEDIEREYQRQIRDGEELLRFLEGSGWSVSERNVNR